MRPRSFTLAFIVSASAALASPPYPVALKTHLSLKEAPPCLVCHCSPTGGQGTVVKPFGKSLLSLGATGGQQTARLDAALDALAAATTDSDGDGAPDVDELQVGGNPNVKSATDGGSPESDDQCTLLPPARYGCGADTTVALLGLWGLLGVGFACKRARRLP